MVQLLLIVEQQVVVEVWKIRRKFIIIDRKTNHRRLVTCRNIPYLKNFSGFDLNRLPTNSGDSPSLKDGRVFS